MIGSNGSGKTTLLRLAAGAISSTAGHVSFSDDCQPIFLPTVIERFLLPWYSIRKNLTFFRRLRTAEPSLLTKDIALLRGFFPDLADTHLDREVYRLSTGEKAVLGYVCAMSTRPTLLILDELFGNLNDSITAPLIEQLKESLKSGVSILFTSHNQDVVRKLSHRTIELE